MSQNDAAHGHEADVATEADKTASGVIAAVAAGISITVLVLLAILNSVITRVVEDQVSKKVLEPESSTLRSLRVTEAQRLARYQWVDQANGVVRLPIERAAELVLSRYNAENQAGETGVRR